MENDKNSVAINLMEDNMEWNKCSDVIPRGCMITILNGDPSQNNTDALVKFEPKTDIPEHWHNSAERMILLQGQMEITYLGEETKTLEAGYYAYGPAKKPLTARCAGDEPCLLFIAFEKPVDAFAGKGQ